MVPPATWEAASDSEGTFTLAAVVDPGAGTTCGGLDIRSATMLRRPGTWTILFDGTGGAVCNVSYLHVRIIGMCMACLPYNPRLAVDLGPHYDIL